MEVVGKFYWEDLSLIYRLRSIFICHLRICFIDDVLLFCLGPIEKFNSTEMIEKYRNLSYGMQAVRGICNVIAILMIVTRLCVDQFLIYKNSLRSKRSPSGSSGFDYIFTSLLWESMVFSICAFYSKPNSILHFFNIQEHKIFTKAIQSKIVLTIFPLNRTSEYNGLRFDVIVYSISRISSHFFYWDA